MELRKVTYNKAFGITFLIFALLILVINLVFVMSVSIITGIFILIISIMYLTQSYIVYDENEFQIKNLYGMTMKRYSWSSLNFVVEEKAIYEYNKKIRMNSWMLNADEYTSFLLFAESKAMKINS